MQRTIAPVNAFVAKTQQVLEHLSQATLDRQPVHSVALAAQPAHASAEVVPSPSHVPKGMEVVNIVDTTLKQALAEGDFSAGPENFSRH